MSRSYGQFCGLARAAEIVGERWALLIVRDLAVRPQRFSELRTGLPGIPSNILTTRLKELEAAGVVERRITPPLRGVRYHLTNYGEDLGDIVQALGLWGARRMSTPLPGEVPTSDSLAAALQAGRTDYSSPRRCYQVQAGPAVAHAEVEGTGLAALPGAAEHPDLIVEGPGLRGLLAGTVTAKDALRQGLVHCPVPEKRPAQEKLLTEFTRTFHVPLDPQCAGETTPQGPGEGR